jgi:hypothetical protein
MNHDAEGGRRAILMWIVGANERYMVCGIIVELLF